ncbi:uncharacterized protein LOC122627274 [Vespula pensylvanica]|uniref:uncharacterized protein LOC122627274 n=1 Tax=Vespula pensylvanica TaxID=30213 RepID=UPI001CBA104A|nr:uncharacterized protein LOC122627274 [Vespula pensylvanica]
MDGQPFLIQISLRLYVCCAYTSYIVPIIAGVFRRKKTKQFTLQIESCIQIMEQLNIPINLSRCFWQQCYIMYIKIKFSQLNDLLKSMLTTTIDSPQHKRIIRSRNIKNNDPLLNNIRRTYKLDDDAMKIKKARCIKSEFERANELLGDVSVLPISSIASELFEHKEAGGSFSIEQSLPINSEKLFIVTPLLRQRQTQLQISSHKINRSRMLLRTIRQIHLELWRASKSFMEEISDTQGLILQLIRTLLLCLQHSTKIFAVNYLCDKTTKEAAQTNEIIHTFYGQNTDFEIQKEVEIFSLQMMQRPNVYSAFGLYNLNCKHICSCIGIITTYMVIMVQVTDSIKGGS